jgi:hypothetical protein
MTSTEATSEVFLTAFRALKKREREAVLEKLLKDKQLVEDLMDLVVLKQRRKEPSRRLDAYLAERKRNS